MKLKEVLIWLCVLVGVVGVGEVAVQAVVTTTAPRNDYTGTGATATYSYTFRIFDATDLLVIQTDAAGNVGTLTYPTHYTVTGVNKAAGGTITLTAGVLGSGEQLAIKFNRTPRQSTDLRNQGSFLPETHESKFDELTRYIQALEEKSSRSLKQPDHETGTSARSTLPASRANTFLAFDASSNPIAASGTSADLGPVSVFINTLLDDTTAAGARSTLGAVGLTGDETVAGVKTFSSTPVFSTATVGTSLNLTGGKVAFPATQVASAGVNDLDDYEESSGCVLTLGGNTTYTTRTCNYTKIGRQVTVHFRIVVNAIGTGSASTITFSSMAAVAADGHGVGACRWGSGAVSPVNLNVYAAPSTSTLVMVGNTGAVASDGTLGIFGNGTDIVCSVTYMSAT